MTQIKTQEALDSLIVALKFCNRSERVETLLDIDNQFPHKNLSDIVEHSLVDAETAFIAKLIIMARR